MSRRELTFKHFSHTHDLQLSNYDESQTTQKASFCAACQTKASGWICSCKFCNYVLHFQCSIAPQKLHLPFHHAHALSLVPDQVLFKCQACGDQGFKFSYSCTNCNVHLHFDCARAPLVLTGPSHDHALDLVQSHFTKTVICKVCDIDLSNCWHYDCFECNNFYAHPDCAKSNKSLDSSTQISSGSNTSMTNNESIYNPDSSIKPKVQKNSAEISYKEKEKGSNSRNQNDRPTKGNRFGNRKYVKPVNFGDMNRYGDVKGGNRNKQNYDSTQNSGGGGNGGHNQPHFVDNTNQYHGNSSDDSRPRFGNRKIVRPVNSRGGGNGGDGLDSSSDGTNYGDDEDIDW